MDKQEIIDLYLEADEEIKSLIEELLDDDYIIESLYAIG